MVLRVKFIVLEKNWSISDITALPKALKQKEVNTLKKGADVKK